MEFIRLSQAVSIMTADTGVVLRSDLGTLQLDGADVQVFIQAMLPLLNGTRDRDGVADALEGYSRHSVFAFLDVLEQQGFLERTQDAGPALPQERWRGQVEFFRKWTGDGEETARRLADARVLIVGLEPWGVVAATELAAAGIGALHLLDNRSIGHDELLAVRAWSSEDVGHLRRERLGELLTRTAPWCSVTTGALLLGEERSLALDDTNWTVAIGAGTADDLLLLEGLARFAHRGNIISVSGYIDGLTALLGPVVVPGQTACWNCCRLRQLANSSYPQEAHALQASLLSGFPAARAHTYLAPMAPILGQSLALETLKLVSQYAPSSLTGRLLTQDLVSLETSVHTVIRLPWCEVCGGSSGDHPPFGGPVLGRQTEEGRPETEPRLDTISDPKQLRDTLSGWVDERTGVIRHLAVVEPRDDEPEVPIACTATVGFYTEGRYVPSGPEKSGAGKGLSTTEAMISAVGEALERYSATRYRRANLYRASLRDMSEDALDPRRLCLYQEAQYADPHFPYARFSPDLCIDWVRGQWLDSGEPVWLPALPTYLDFEANPEEQFCQVTSNGLAAGSTWEDAALRAVFELVERDAFMVTWLCQLPGQRLLLDNSVEGGVHEVVRQLSERGVEVELYLVDVGLSIPTVVCLGLGDGKHWPSVTVALAGHLDPLVAARKAILEQGHVAPYIRRLMHDTGSAIPSSPEEVWTLTDHALYYVPAERLRACDPLRRGGGDPLRLSQLARPEDISLNTCRQRLVTAGVRVALADVTSPDVVSSPFRVVRALGTDLQPIDFGYRWRRLGNPRLAAMNQRGYHPHPHPLA